MLACPRFGMLLRITESRLIAPLCKRGAPVTGFRSTFEMVKTMFKLSFSTDNAAFSGDDRALETARILREIADKLEDGRENGVAMDYNGNRVGEWEFEDGE